MARQQLSFPSPPAMPVAIGATSPDPGRLGVVIWSTLALQQLVWDGAQWSVQGDVVAALMPLVGHTEVVRTDGRVSAIVVWSDATKTRKISETVVTRGASTWTESLVRRRYGDAGAVLQATKSTVVRDATGRVTGVTVERA